MRFPAAGCGLSLGLGKIAEKLRGNRPFAADIRRVLLRFLSSQRCLISIPVAVMGYTIVGFVHNPA